MGSPRESNISETLMLFPAGSHSHAPIFRLPVKVRGSEGRNLDYGARWPESFAKFDQISFSWRIAQCSLTGGLEEYSETWPRSGSMRNGMCFQRVNAVRHTHGRGCSFWPTPRASDGDGQGCLGRMNAKNLRDAVREHFGKGPLNPEFQEWLMGFPRGYTALKLSETRSVRRRRRSRSKS